MEKLNNENFVLQRMQELLKAKDWSIYRLAKESGLSYSSLNNIFIRSTVPSVLTLEKICNGFQITMSEFFDPCIQYRRYLRRGTNFIRKISYLVKGR